MVEIGVGRNPNQSAIAVSFQSLAAGTGGVPLWTPIHSPVLAKEFARKRRSNSRAKFGISTKLLT